MSLRPRTVLFHERSEEFVGPLRAAIPELDLAVARDMEELAALLPEAEIVLCTCFPAEALPLAPYLRWIQLISAGVDGVLPLRDLIGDVTVTNSRGIHSELMADYTLCMMVMLQWDFPRLIRGQANGEWLREPKGALAGKTLCVLGPGAIGAEIGRRAAEFGMHVVGVRRSGTDSPPGFAEMHPSEALDAVLPRADFVCIVVPETPDTRRMIGARQLAGMKKSAFLINISRGALVDEAALISALRDGGIAGAGLDVFEREPPAPDNPLWTMPSVIMTPHISGMMDVNADRVASVFAANLRRYRGGEKMETLSILPGGIDVVTETDRAAGAGPVLPQLSCDSHMHVFGPPERFRGAPDRTYDPRPRELDEYEALAARLGLERTVFVQPSAYGSDNSCLLEALARRPRTARGVAVIDDSYDRRAIEALHGRGIRGIRLNLMTPRISDGEEARSRLERAARQVEGLDWHLQIYADLEVVRMIAPACRGLAMPVVFDHMAGASQAAGRDAAGFDDLLSLLADGKCWVKLSGADIVTWENSDFSGAEPFARAIIQASSTNVVWGSDWPHLVHHHSGTGDDAPPAGFRPVDEEALLRFLAEWAGSDAVFERILVSNPSRLYDF